MTDKEKDSKANKKLTGLLRDRCGDQNLRVELIRWDDYDAGTVRVQVQRTLGLSSFMEFPPIIMASRIATDPIVRKSCLDDDVIMAIADNFPCEKLKNWAGNL